MFGSKDCIDINLKTSIDQLIISEDDAKAIAGHFGLIDGWHKISEKAPPEKTWIEFYDGNQSMGHHPPFNHIDRVNHRGESRVNAIENYTHWRYLSMP